jgi:phenylacetate-CoA ligase
MISRMLRDWIWLQRSQWFRQDQLAVFQDRKLREIISHAFQKVPFYQGLYKAVGVDIGGVKDAKNLNKLPLIDRRIMASTSLTQRTAIDTDPTSCIPMTTSGSTGTPLTVFEDQFSACYRAALYARFFWASGVRPWHKVCLTGPGSGRRTVFSAIMEGVSAGVLRRRVKTISLEAGIDEAIRLLLKWKAHALVARPSDFRRLIEYCEGKGQYLLPKVAITGHEMLDSPTRMLIGNSLHVDVFDFYGLTEVGLVAWECPTRAGYHINGDSLVVEFLRDGEPVSPGEPGEVCITNLYRTATPIIRYLTEDMATPIDDECACGRGLPLLKNIQSRIIQRH